jgi:DNA-binding transcriptional ArsR family regulator
VNTVTVANGHRHPDAPPEPSEPWHDADEPSQDAAEPFARPRTAWTAADLMATDFPPPRWAVPGLICEGVTLLTGPPKVGKSWLSLGLAVAVASGTEAMGKVRVQQGPVLYLALEDTARRLKSRLGKVLGDATPPKGLTFMTECAPFPAGAAEVGLWLDEHPDARLVIVDVLAKVRGATAPGADPYQADYAAITRFKNLADRYGVAFLIVHHVRKMASEDFLAEVSGTFGLVGAADATVSLKRGRGQADGVLHVTGRDVDEAEYAAAFDPERGAWLMLDGPAEAHNLGDLRHRIRAHLEANPGSSPKQVAEAIDASYGNVRVHLARMLEDGQVVSPVRGRYALPGVTTVATEQ